MGKRQSPMESLVIKVRILITGGAGFIGANLVHHFASIGNDVIATQRQKERGWRLKDLKDIDISILDITKRAEVFEELKSLKPEVVIHTACYGAYHFETERYKIVRTNLMGTINLVDASIDSGAKLFINTGTSSEYGIKDESMAEADAISPDTDYSVSKALATEYCSYKRESETKVVTLRLFSAYGYYEEKHRLVPYLLYSAIKKRKAELSSLDNVRDFVFIDDIKTAYEKTINAIPKIANGSVFNVGTGTEHTISDVVGSINGLEVEINKGKRMKETIKHWHADINKSSKFFGWYPKTSLKEGLDKTRAWMEKNVGLYEDVSNEKPKRA